MKDLLYLPHTLAVVIAVPKSKKNESHNNNNSNNNNSNNNSNNNKDESSTDHITLLALSTTVVHEDSVFLCVPVMSLSTFTRCVRTYVRALQINHENKNCCETETKNRKCRYIFFCVFHSSPDFIFIYLFQENAFTLY